MIKEWIKVHYDDLNIRSLERKIGCSRGTIERFVKGERSFPEHWEIELERYLRWLFEFENLEGEFSKTESTPLEVIGKKEKVKILEKVIEKLNDIPKEDPLFTEPVEMGFDMMEGFKPDPKELEGMTKKTDNIKCNKYWYDSHMMIRKNNGFVEEHRYSRTMKEAIILVEELKGLKK